MNNIKKFKKEIEKYLEQNQIDGWLLYDFQGRNKIATQLVLDKMSTRRRFVLINKNEIIALVSEIEKQFFEDITDKILTYKTNEEFIDQLIYLLKGTKKVCMEYSPMGELPTVSYVDGGTIELIKSFGIEIVSSSSLIQICTANWGGQKGLNSHKNALNTLHKCMDYAKSKIYNDIIKKGESDEYKIQQGIMNILNQNNMITNHPCIVATNPNNANPHYFPTKDRTTKIVKGDLIMIDIWCKENKVNSIYADITWMFYVGNNIPTKIQNVWKILVNARNKGLDYLTNNYGKSKIKGSDLDKIIRDEIIKDGYGKYFTHRTGHSIQYEDHANGVNIDNYEIKDSREIINDCGFSIEPGIYIPNEFGLRTEIDVYIENNTPNIYGAIQNEIVLIN